MSMALERARSAIGLRTVYALGRGGSDPRALTPFGIDVKRRSDCTGFLAWAFGSPRRVPQTIGWIETSRIFRDAQGPQLVFAQIDDPEESAVVVYGDKGKRQGHVGIVSSVEPFLVIHCALGNYRRTGDAIQETPGDFFLARGAIFCEWL